jgi:uncharacterized protein YraI
VPETTVEEEPDVAGEEDAVDQESVEEPATEVRESLFQAVTTTSMNVRSGPGTDYDIFGGLTAGQEVEVIGEVEGWYEIRLADGTIAWGADWLLVDAEKVGENASSSQLEQATVLSSDIIGSANGIPVAKEIREKANGITETLLISNPDGDFQVAVTQEFYDYADPIKAKNRLFAANNAEVSQLIADVSRAILLDIIPRNSTTLPGDWMERLRAAEQGGAEINFIDYDFNGTIFPKVESRVPLSVPILLIFEKPTTVEKSKAVGPVGTKQYGIGSIHAPEEATFFDPNSGYYAFSVGEKLEVHFWPVVNNGQMLGLGIELDAAGKLYPLLAHLSGASRDRYMSGSPNIKLEGYQYLQLYIDILLGPGYELPSFGFAEIY